MTLIKNNTSFIISGEYQYIPPDSKIGIYHDLTIYFSDILESFLGYKFICISDFILAKVDWIPSVDEKLKVLFYSDTTNLKINTIFLNTIYSYK